MLEAMASSLPIIATDVGSNKDMIEDKGGIIIQPKNSKEIIRAIEEMKKEEKRRSCSKWNYQKVIEQYSVDSVMSCIKQLYDQVSAKKTI